MVVQAVARRLGLVARERKMAVTVVVGFNCLSEIVMVADTRVSWQDDARPPTDILQKLYAIRRQGKAAVFGFSGNVPAARIVMDYVVRHRLRNYRRARRFVLTRLKDDLRRWIEEVAQDRLQPAERGWLKFMLCGILPSRHPQLKRNGMIVGSMPYPESHIYVYTVAKDSGKVHVKRQPMFAVIGPDRGTERDLRTKVQPLIRFGFGAPQLHWGRAVLIGEVIASMFKDRQSEIVGGPFQAVRITPEGLETHYIWPPDTEHKNVEVRDDGARVIVYNPALKAEYTLYPIWDLPF